MNAKASGKEKPKTTPAPKVETPAKPPEPSKVGTVAVEKADTKVLTASLVSVLKYPADKAAKASKPEAIAALNEHFEKNFKAGDLADCDGEEGCGGASPTALDACPFCGVSGVTADPPADTNEGEEEGGEEEEEEEEEESEKEGDDFVPPKKAASTPAPKAEKAASTPAPKAEKVAEPAAKDEKAAGKKGKGKGKDEKAAEPAADKAALAVVVKDKTALDIPEGVTVERLDESVARFLTKKSEGMAVGWDVGDAARAIFDGQLWKARVTETTAEDKTVTKKATYKSWNEFCQKELGMTPSNVYNLMDVARTFTREQTSAMGTTKAAIMLKVPEEHQAALLEMAQSHSTSKRDLESKVKELTAGKKGAKRETGRKKMPEGKGGGRAKKVGKGKTPEGITIATLAEKTLTIPLYVRPPKGEEPTTRAERIDQKPVGFKDLENKATIIVSIVADTAGLLQAKISFQPIEPDEEAEA